MKCLRNRCVKVKNALNRAWTCGDETRHFCVETRSIRNVCRRFGRRCRFQDEGGVIHFLFCLAKIILKTLNIFSHVFLLSEDSRILRIYTILYSRLVLCTIICCTILRVFETHHHKLYLENVLFVPFLYLVKIK